MAAVLQLENLTKIYRYGFRPQLKLAVDDLSFEIQEGQVYGLLGPNGAGKTTTLKLIIGLLRPTSGRLMIFSCDNREKSVRMRIGFLPEQPYFYQYLTAEKTLDFYARFFSISREQRRMKIDRLLELVGLTDDRKVPLSRFSRGMLQRIGIAQALLNDPDFVILDEPASGLDPIGQMEMRNLILRLKEQGKTILLSSHQLTEVEQICDFVSVLNRGRLIAEGDIDDLLTVEDQYELVFASIGPKATPKLKRLCLSLEQMNKQSVAVVEKAQIYQVLDFLKSEGVEINRLSRRRLSLEEYFLHLIGEAK